MPSTVFASLKVYLEASVESQVGRFTQSQPSGLVVQTAAQMMLRFQAKYETTMTEIIPGATSSTEATVVGQAGLRSLEGEQRLL